MVSTCSGIGVGGMVEQLSVFIVFIEKEMVTEHLNILFSSNLLGN